MRHVAWFLYYWIISMLVGYVFVFAESCDNKLGMESKRIPDESITASSQRSVDHSPSFARVDGPKAWCSKPDDKSPFIQIQLDEPKLITAITTQGSQIDLSWSKKYEVKYLEKANWKSYKEELIGNRNSGALKKNKLNPVIRSQTIRIYPKDPFSVMFHMTNSFCLRLELHGCSAPAVDCGPLSVPVNGSSSGDYTVFPNSVLFNCDPGFILSGSTIRTCQPNGTWSGLTTVCSAVDCGPLSVPVNGSSSGDITVFPNSVQFNCDPGFILNGSAIRMCQANGAWSGFQTLCNAVDCGQPKPLQNGSIVGEKTVYPNFMTHICDDGFILRGSPKINCQTNGTWSKTSSFCEAKDCGALPVPLNGSINVLETTFPNEATFSCDEGFILNGSTVRRCHANGTWSGIEASCHAKDCGPLVDPTNGSSIGNLTVFPNKILFDCEEGFLLRGSDIRHCQANGNWSGNQTFCEAVDCGPLSVPMNGSSSGNFTVFPHSIQFYCDPGFHLNGSKTRTCQANRAWSGVQTLCGAKDCGPLAIPLHGSLTGNETTFPNEANLNCDEGFILHGSSVRRCQANGTWSGIDTSCHAKDCGPLAVPTNGSSAGDLTIFPNKINFICDKGFNLLGSQTRYCQENGTWSGYQTYCEAVECGPLSVPVNGSSSGDLTVFPNSMLFKCDSGFILSGSTIRTCQANGTWSGLTTICSAVDCGPLPAPMNGSFSGDSTVFPNGVRFNCDPGFTLSGSSIRMCQANGTWSGFPTVCSAVDCGRPKPLQNGSIVGEHTVYPNYVSHLCDEGFILRGPPRIQCQSNGTWSRSSSFCEAKDCGPLTVPLNGSITGRETTFPNKVILSCNGGFILYGSIVRNCQADATWSGNETSCKAVDCGPLSVPRNGTLVGDLTVFPNTVHFSCSPGFILSGSNARRCQAKGSWSGTETFCTPVDCGVLIPLQNGTLIGESTFYPNVVNAACDVGFILRGSSRIECQANGTWSSTDTFCEAKDCGYLSRPLNGSLIGSKTTYPNELQFKCDVGFEVHGSATRKCEADGQWSGEEVKCQAKSCGNPGDLPNGKLKSYIFTFKSKVYFQCNHGYKLFGDKYRQCQANERWSGRQPKCEPIDCGVLPTPDKGEKVMETHTRVGGVVRFQCNEKGYEISGSEIRTCQNDGLWSGLPTSCKTTPESATTISPMTQPPVCSTPEKPAQEAGVMGFGHNLYSHVVYNITRHTVLNKLLSTRTRLSLEFRASNPNGILLYTAFQPTQSDFIECHLEEGRVSCSFSTGLHILSLTSPQASYSDGKWHTVRLMRENVQGELYLDGIRVDTGSALGSKRYINGLKELYLGGTPMRFDSRHVTPGSRLSLPGCIRNVTVNTRDIGPPTNAFKIKNCYRVSPSSGVSFGKGGGFLKAASGYTVGKEEVITLEIKPTSHSGVLLSSSRINGDYIVLEMIRGNIIFRAENGGGEDIVEYVAANQLELCDGKWHKITARKYGNVVRLQVDDGAVLEGGGNGSQTHTNINDPLYVGGVPDGVTARGVTATEPYTGCIRNLESRDPGRDAKNLFLTKPLQMAGNIYLGGCPFI